MRWTNWTTWMFVSQRWQFKNIDVWLLFLEALLQSMQASQGRFHYFFGGGEKSCSCWSQGRLWYLTGPCRQDGNRDGLACLCVYVIVILFVAAINCWFGCHFVPKLEVHFGRKTSNCRMSRICVNSTGHHKRGDSGTRPWKRRKNGNAFHCSLCWRRSLQLKWHPDKTGGATTEQFQFLQPCAQIEVWHCACQFPIPKFTPYTDEHR